MTSIMAKNFFAVFAVLCLVSSPAMASLVVQVQPVSLYTSATGTTTALSSSDSKVDIQGIGDTITFQVICSVSTGVSTDGTQHISGSLAQLLSSTSGVWDTAVKGTLSSITWSTEFTYSNNLSGAFSVDVNNDGFALDIGSTATFSPDYIHAYVHDYGILTSRSAVTDIVGTFTYTITDVQSSENDTLVYWLTRSAGARSNWATWYENGVLVSPITKGYLDAYIGDSSYGIKINVVPEPSISIVLGIGCLTLLAFRRVKML
jgi:hypothetical protein